MSIAPQPQQEERTWAALCHAAAFATFVLPSFGSIIGPLVVWLIKKDVSPFVNDQGKEALNFQITAAIAWVAALIISAVTFGIGSLLFPLLWIAILVFCIMAGVKANEGTAYRYPVAIRFIK